MNKIHQAYQVTKDRLQKEWKRLSSAMTIQTLVKAARAGEFIHVLISWVIVVIALVVCGWMLIHSAAQLSEGNLASAVVSALTALIMIIICLAVDRYTNTKNTDS